MAGAVLEEAQSEAFVVESLYEIHRVCGRDRTRKEWWVYSNWADPDRCDALAIVVVDRTPGGKGSMVYGVNG